MPASGRNPLNRSTKSTTGPPLLESATVGTKRKPWLLLGALALGCGGTGALHQGVFRGDQTSYAVAPMPSDWRRVSVEGQNDLAWRNQAHAAVMHVDSSCDPGLDIPLKPLTNHLLFGFTEREVIDQQVVPMDDREALRTHLKARLDGVPRELVLQVLKKDGCVYDFALVAPPGDDFLAVLPDFDLLTDQFRTVSR